MLVRLRGDAVERVEIVNRSAQAYLRSDCGRARFELVRDGRVSASLERDGANHRAAADERVHLFEQVRLAVENTAARRREHLVTRNGVEVAVQVLHVNL